MELRNTYKLERYISYDTATAVDDGSPIPYLETLPPDLTRISTELNEIIIKLIKCIVEKYKISHLIRYSDSILGIFNGLSCENIIDLTDKNSDFLKLNANKLVLLDLSNRNLDISRSKYNDIFYLKEKLSNDDFILVSTGKETFNIHSVTILESIESSELQIVAVLCLDDVLSGAGFCPQLRSANAFPEIDDYDRGIHFYLLSIKKQEREFIAHTSILNFDYEILINFIKEQSSKLITNGIFLTGGTYKGPIAWKAREEFLREEPNFKHWQKLDFECFVKYGEIEDIEELKKNEKQNSSDRIRFLEFVEITSNDDLYKLSFNRLSQIEVSNTKLYLPIEFEINTVLPEFVELFFQTPIGKNIVKIVSSNSYLSIDALNLLWIYAPSIDEQKNIIQLTNNYKKAYQNIKDLQVNLVMNPDSTNYALEKVNGILGLFNQLDNYSRINQLIREGESLTLEFKQTFSLDIKTGTKEDRIETSAIKTIAGFLNTKGGKLLIGVSDDGQISGLDQEISKFYKSADKFMLHVKNIIKSKIGEDNYPFLDVNLLVVRDLRILEITCTQSTKPVFVNGNDFYVRANPATDKLEGPKMVNYINNRFKITS